MPTKAQAKKASTRKASTRKASTKKVQREDKVYRTLHYTPKTFSLQSGRGKASILISEFEGEQLDHQKAIRHCPAEISIFKDNQSEDAEVVPIVFQDGFFEAKAHEVRTQEFLDNHPMKGKTFDVIDPGADAIAFADEEEMRTDAKVAVRKKMKEEGGEEILRIIVSALTSDMAGASKMTPAELKATLYSEIDNNVYRFVNDDGEVTIFDDQDVIRQALSNHAFNAAVVQIGADGGAILWSSNSAQICIVPEGVDHMEYFAEFLGTKEGLQVAREIKKRL